MDVSATMVLLQTNLQTAFPDQLVTRDAREFSSYSKAQARAGVITIVADRVTDLNAQRDMADISGRLSIYAIYEFARPENTAGSAIEDEESRFLSELIDFIAAPGAGLCPLDLGAVQFSQQRNVPDGWLFAPLAFSEID